MTRAFLAMAFALLAASFASAQTMYKWVDEKGVTHYSESPPPEGKANKVEIKTEPGRPVAPDDWKERERQFRERKLEQSKKEDAAAAHRAREERERADRCRRAQQALDRLRNVRRLYELDAKGERVYIEDSARPALIAKHEREAAESCR